MRTAGTCWNHRNGPGLCCFAGPFATGGPTSQRRTAVMTAAMHRVVCDALRRPNEPPKGIELPVVGKWFRERWGLWRRRSYQILSFGRTRLAEVPYILPDFPVPIHLLKASSSLKDPNHTAVQSPGNLAEAGGDCKGEWVNSFQEIDSFGLRNFNFQTGVKIFLLHCLTCGCRTLPPDFAATAALIPSRKYRLWETHQLVHITLTAPCQDFYISGLISLEEVQISCLPQGQLLQEVSGVCVQVCFAGSLFRVGLKLLEGVMFHLFVWVLVFAHDHPTCWAIIAALEMRQTDTTCRLPYLLQTRKLEEAQFWRLSLVLHKGSMAFWLKAQWCENIMGCFHINCSDRSCLPCFPFGRQWNSSSAALVFLRRMSGRSMPACSVATNNKSCTLQCFGSLVYGFCCPGV